MAWSRTHTSLPSIERKDLDVLAGPSACRDLSPWCMLVLNTYIFIIMADIDTA